MRGLCVVTHGELSIDCKESFRGKKYSKLAWRYIRSWLRDASNIIIFNLSLYLHSENIRLKKSLCSPALIESEKVGKENNAFVGIHMRRLHCIKLQPANWTRTSHNGCQLSNLSFWTVKVRRKLTQFWPRVFLWSLKYTHQKVYCEFIMKCGVTGYYIIIVVIN